MHSALSYEQAITQNSDPGAMFSLANILREGAKEVEQNIVRSMSLCERAILELPEYCAMNNLENLLTEGKEEVERSPTCTNGRFLRVIVTGQCIIWQMS